MIKAVLFDFDGTLSSRQDNAYNLFRDLLKPYFKNLNDIEYEAVLQDLMIMDCNGTINLKYRFAPFVDKYKDYFSLKDSEEFSKLYYDKMGEYVVLRSETIKVLEALKDKYKLGLITNGFAKTQHSKIEHSGIEQYFDEIIVSGDFEEDIKKPNKKIFDIMLEKLSVKADECVYVGDVFSSDVLGAINANIKPIWLVTDYDKPSKYDGIKIKELSELLEVLEKIK